jgi:MauM/NapG family ferredoxin protein
MRWNWFAPVPKKRVADDLRGPSGFVPRVARRWLPKSWLSDPQTGRRGLLRRVLAALGSTWASSPLRRIVQTVCLLAFGWLFLYVCWPYTARPARTWPNWHPDEVDVEQGLVTVTTDEPLDEPLAPGSRWYVCDPAAGEQPCLGLFEVQAAGERRLELRPVQPLNQQQSDGLAASFGPWSLSENEPGQWPSHYADGLLRKERLAAETFLALDPLVSISTALAARSWVWSLTAAAIILLVSWLVPRCFCGYLCPLGSLIDLFDWSLARRVRRFRVTRPGWWVGLKYYLLLAVLVAAMCGILLSGFVAAIPVLTRAAAFLLTPVATGLARDWHQIPAWHAGHFVSLVLFALVLALGFLQPRFWCKYVCPTGAVFSLGTWFRVNERKVLESCIDCGKCREHCPFDAIATDFTTRTSDCTFCQTCGGVCPTDAVQFTGRWERAEWKGATAAEAGAPVLARRGFLTQAIGLLGGAAGGAGLALTTRLSAAAPDPTGRGAVVRPPGSVPEPEFLRLCIRCGECYQACPNNVLQPLGLERGLDNLWTPQVVANWSGCEPSCSNCGQVCPTGAIRALPLEEKRVARLGLAVVNQQTCLPYAGKEACQLCVDECRLAGYEAIEFVRVGTELDESGEPVEGSGFLAPTVRSDRCNGCGLCQTRCYRINVKLKRLLTSSAIVVEAGEGREDRLRQGSYQELRDAERRARAAAQPAPGTGGPDHGYLPDFLK